MIAFVSFLFCLVFPFNLAFFCIFFTDRVSTCSHSITGIYTMPHSVYIISSRNDWHLQPTPSRGIVDKEVASGFVLFGRELVPSTKLPPHLKEKDPVM